MSTSSKLKQQFGKPIAVGICAALGAKALGLDYNVQLPLLGDVPAAVFYGVVGVGSSFATETIHQWVLPYLPQSAYATQVESAALSPAINAALNIGILKMWYPGVVDTLGYMNPVMLGVASQVAGAYAFDNFITGMSWMQ